MSKKSKKCVCHECEIEFDIVVVSEKGKKAMPEICPFCGDIVDLRDDRPFLKNFDEYDEFNEDEYYSDDDELEDD